MTEEEWCAVQSLFGMYYLIVDDRPTRELSGNLEHYRRMVVAARYGKEHPSWEKVDALIAEIETSDAGWSIREILARDASLSGDTERLKAFRLQVWETIISLKDAFLDPVRR